MGRQPVELDEAGRAQVELAVPLARVLAPDLIVSSPLPRAVQSAEIISRGVGGIDIITDDRLEEVRYGDWEGKIYHQLIQEESYINYRKAPLESAHARRRDHRARCRRAAWRRWTPRSPRIAASACCSYRTATLSAPCCATTCAWNCSTSIACAWTTRPSSGIEISDDFAEVKFINLLPDPDRAFRSPFKK